MKMADGYGLPGILEFFGFVVWVSYNEFGAKRLLAGIFLKV